jgi:hypothetical protein
MEDREIVENAIIPKKGILKAGDDAILPMILKALIGNYIMQEGANKDKWGVIKESMNIYLYEEIMRLPAKLRRNFEQRLLRAHRKVYNHFVDNGWTTIKALMVVLRVAETLEEEGKVFIEPVVLREYEDIRAKITFDLGLTDINGERIEKKVLTEEEIAALSEEEKKELKKVRDLALTLDSAHKQTPKIIRLLRTQAYF